MGRHRKQPAEDNDIRDQKHVKNPSEEAEDRIGLNNQVCYNCNGNNSKSADKCRKCGSQNLRPKASQYRND